MVYKRKSKRYWKLWNSVNDSHVYISYIYINIIYIYIIYIIYIYTHRIHGAGIYANIGGILMGSMLPYIAAPWILWVIYTPLYMIYTCEYI
jgi:hypothetical protein